MTRRDWTRVRRSAAALVVGFTLAVIGALLLLNVTVLTAVAIAGLPAQRVIWQRAARRAAALPLDLEKTGG